MSSRNFKCQSYTKSVVRWGGVSRTLSAVLLTVFSVSGMTGCNAWSGARDSWAYNGCWNNMMMAYRNEALANKAWHSRKHQFCNEKHNHEFCEGFRAGYADVADGGNGCNPAFPPRQYWGWKYQSAEGQAKVAAWYAGFPHGARAAEEDGIGNWTQIQTSTSLQNQYAQHNKLGDGQVAGMYPMPQAQPPAAALARSKADAAVADGVLMTNPVETSLSEATFTPAPPPPARIPSTSTLIVTPNEPPVTTITPPGIPVR